jgi:DNA-binding transcriptional MerR regulator
MRINELVKATGASARSLRHYEKKGLLEPRRSENGYRYYSADSVHIVERIQWLLSAGLTTAKIRKVLPCLLEEEPHRITCPNLRTQLESEIDRIQQQITNFEFSRDLLRSALNKESDFERSQMTQSEAMRSIWR